MHWPLYWVCWRQHLMSFASKTELNSEWRTFNEALGTFLWDFGQYVLHSRCTCVNSTPSLPIFLSITLCRLALGSGDVVAVGVPVGGTFLLQFNNFNHFGQNQWRRTDFPGENHLVLRSRSVAAKLSWNKCSKETTSCQCVWTTMKQSGSLTSNWTFPFYW